METKNTNGAHTLNGSAKNNKAAQNGATVRGSIPNPKKDNANGKPEAEKLHSAQLKDETQEVDQPGQPKPEEQSQALQIKEVVLPAKTVMNLEDKLKVVNDLHRKSIQILNLKSRMKQLETFEIALLQEHDELEDNPYNGCKLIIEDDKKRQFITGAPGLIRLVSQFIFNSCNEKREEIEASIVFPNA
jgi:hypothetical protein